MLSELGLNSEGPKMWRGGGGVCWCTGQGPVFKSLVGEIRGPQEKSSQKKINQKIAEERNNDKEEIIMMKKHTKKE